MIWFQKVFHFDKLIKRQTVNRENNQIIAPAKGKKLLTQMILNKTRS